MRNWRDNELIDNVTYKRLICNNGNLPRWYGLPKVHKENHPLRIIVSSLGSPTYNITLYLHDILSHSVNKPTSHMRDSWSFAKNIKRFIIKEGELLISLRYIPTFQKLLS